MIQENMEHEDDVIAVIVGALRTVPKRLKELEINERIEAI